MPKQTRQLPDLHTRADFAPATLNEAARTVELTWSTGAQSRRFDDWDDWIEELSMNPADVRMDFLNSGSAPLLADHNNYGLGGVIGVVERAWIKDGVGHAVVRFSERDDVEVIFKDVKAGILKNISVGYKIYKMEKQPQTETQSGLPIYLATDWEPKEISIVPIPIEGGAKIRSEGNTSSVTIINKEVKAMPKTVEEKTTETRADNAPAVSVKPEARIDESAIRADAAKQERQRQVDIRKFAQMSRADDAVVNGFIERGDSFEVAKEQMLKKWSEKVDSEATRGDASVTTDEKDKFIEAGVNAIRGRAGVDKMDAGNEFRGMRMTEIAKLCLDRAGVSSRGMGELEMVKRAFTTSTSDFPVLLENAMHKTLQGAYATAPDTWSRFCSVGSVTDFRAHNRYRLGSFGNLDALGENSEFKNKSIPDGEKSTITATTKGNVINISRQTIINDDLSAFIGLSKMLGRAARRTIEADVYALLASNPLMSDGIALFDAAHDNLAGTAAVVSVASIEAARVAMAKQMDVSGNDFLDLRPALWLGGMGAGGSARVVNEAQYDPDTANKLQSPNRVRGLFRDVIDSPRISGNEWYVFADPAESPVIEVAFLNGEQEPFLESEQGFEVDGLQWKVRLDYGVGLNDYRGAYKNAGA
ncbi:hypothetical protein B0F88_103102 [Methylobacter tundripaludum]|uniref:Peptidase U35 phage prohead HK97 n=1 Tax=Methylobacter tundripaludum TaxID=173365 RepID=A0A2S6H5A4_9GAMM|nr:prohead protease/major capsid protein fusion protein [Methylobacter tundripaludum]PPK72669.1 hypothetical protein B0F88_103102 [Methylobacter tundripaludum]